MGLDRGFKKGEIAVYGVGGRQSGKSDLMRAMRMGMAYGGEPGMLAKNWTERHNISEAEFRREYLAEFKEETLRRSHSETCRALRASGPPIRMLKGRTEGLEPVRESYYQY